jgi:lactoylglutathione lyase
MSPSFIACSPLRLGSAASRFNCRRTAAVRPCICAQRAHTVMSSAKTPTATDAMLHFVYRVGDLARTRLFLSTLGLRVLRERDVPSEKYTNVFFGAGSESNAEHCSLELTYNYGREAYNVGTGLGHIGVAVSDVRSTCEELRRKGFRVVREPGPVADGKSYMAFVEDPTGYRFELLQRVQRDPVCQVTLRVTDLDNSLKFYSALGFHEVRRRSSESGRYTNVKLGYGPEEDSTMLQLTHNWDRDPSDAYDAGDGWAVRMAFSLCVRLIPVEALLL